MNAAAMPVYGAGIALLAAGMVNGSILTVSAGFVNILIGIAFEYDYDN